VINKEVDTSADRVVAPCGRGVASDGAAQAIITNAPARMTRPTTPVSHVAFARSLLTTAVISPPGSRHDSLGPECLASLRISVISPTPLVSAFRHLIAARTGPGKTTGGRPEREGLAVPFEQLTCSRMRADDGDGSIDG
jgi:hypothetical protein